MEDIYTFIALIEPLDDGVYIEFPDLPGCLPCAENIESSGECKRSVRFALIWYGAG